MITIGTKQDIAEFMQVVCFLAEETKLPPPVSGVFVPFWERMIDAETGLILIDRFNGNTTGILGALIVTDQNAGVVIGVVSHWYVKPLFRHSGIGSRMLRRFERWATGKGCTMLSFSKPVPENRKHKKYGYISKEIVFLKEI
jgi:GNAT superfamily N-acetyltransferase